MAVLGVIACANYSVLEFQRTIPSFVFQPPGCTFSASFPGEPERKEIVVPGGPVIIQANFYGSDSLMQAECFAAPPGFSPTTEAVMAELRNYTERNGLSDVKFDVVASAGVIRGLARGQKMVSGRPTSYELHLLADGVSLMSLVVGGASSDYPQAGLNEFSYVRQTCFYISSNPKAQQLLQFICTSE